MLDVKTLKQLSPGQPASLGAILSEDGVNFAISSQYAEQVFLLLFDRAEGEATDCIKLNRTENTWHVFVHGLKAGQLYGYKVAGEYNPPQGKRFNPHKLLIDPYAKALTGKFKYHDYLNFAYVVASPQKDLEMDVRDNSSVVPKSIVMSDDFDWQGDQPLHIPMDQLFIYETHVKGFTAHRSSNVEHPGTYLGFIEKIPYLKELGVNAVEFLPVHEFYVQDYVIQRGLTNFWGYDSIGFFTPESSYSTQSYPGCQVHEFKTMVRELHKAGIEVILDVVYNHAGEGNEEGPTLCFKGIDNQTYYLLCGDSAENPYRYYKNDTGCGNTIDAEHPAVMNFILDSLRYWREVMHVDGFRFDLASILARVHGQFDPNSTFLEAVSKDPILKDVKMIAEPWDLTTYQVGNFPVGWSEWNGKFRDTVRKFVKGDDGQIAEMAKRVTGSADLYQEDGRKPYNSINFVTCHDGFTLNDLYSYNVKHNENNGEENRDGNDHNDSWNCGIEGETDVHYVLQLRQQLIKNALCCLFLSAGTPMMLYGDEILRSQKGNNNAWCQDNPLTWFDWTLLTKNSWAFEFCKKTIAFRKRYSILRRRRFFTGLDHGDEVPDIMWFDRNLKGPKWDSAKLKTLCFQLKVGESAALESSYYLFFIFHMHYRGSRIHLPMHEAKKWYRVIDTSYKPGKDFLEPGREKYLRNQQEHYCEARSVVILLGK
jgi:isoamylase